jgi:hypothetical protein
VTTPPVACDLTTPALRERKAWLQQEIGRHLSAYEWLVEGLTLRLAYSRESLAIASERMQLEAQCCPFLRFDLRAQSGTSLLELELTGPPGTRAFLEQLQLVRS